MINDERYILQSIFSFWFSFYNFLYLKILKPPSSFVSLLCSGLVSESRRTIQFNVFLSFSLQSFGRHTFNAATPTRPGLRSTSSTQECAPVKKSWRKTTRLSKTICSLWATLSWRLHTPSGAFISLFVIFAFKHRLNTGKFLSWKCFLLKRGN